MARITFTYLDHEGLGVQYLMSILRSQGHEAELIFIKSELHRVYYTNIRIKKLLLGLFRKGVLSEG